MPISRRLVLGLSAVLLGAPAAFAQTRRPLVIAHRGASGLRPEHTLMAYQLAIEQGADVIEPDLVVTRDGVLVARHESDVTATTDIAARPEFTALAREGRWHAHDLSWAEYRTLRAKERSPASRPGNVAYDGLEAPPSLQAVIDLARSEAHRLGRPIGLYPELKQWAELKAAGLDTGRLLLDQLAANGLPSDLNPVFIQSFEADALKALAGRTSATLIQTTSNREQLTESGLAAVAEYAQGIGPAKGLVSRQLVDNAHRLELSVHPYTFAAENRALPEAFRIGADPNGLGDLVGEIRSYLAMGVDGFFTDFPALGRAAIG